MHELITAIILAYLTIKYVDYELGRNNKLKNENENENEKEKIRNFIGSFSGIISINILLPIIFLESIYSQREFLSLYLATVLAGFVFAVFTFFIANSVSSKFAPKRYDRWADIATATFGGGNRGILLLIATLALLNSQGLSSGDSKKYISCFYAFDLGNFISFFFFISMIIRIRSSNSNQLGGLANQSSIKSLFIDFGTKIGLPGIILSLGTLIIFLGNCLGWPVNIIDLMESTSAGRKFMLVYFSFVATLIHFKFENQTAEAIYDLIFSFFVRSLMMFFVIILSWQYMSGVANLKIINTITHPFSIAVIILSLCPPSSLLLPQIEKNGVSNNTLAAVSSFSMVSNMFFFATLATLSFVTFILTFK